MGEPARFDTSGVDDVAVGLLAAEVVFLMRDREAKVVDVMLVVPPQPLSHATPLRCRRRRPLGAGRRQCRGLRDVHRHRRHRAIRFAAGWILFVRARFRRGALLLSWASGLILFWGLGS